MKEIATPHFAFTQIAQELRTPAYINDRRPKLAKFHDSSNKKIGRQSMRNRLTHISAADFDWIDINISKDFLSVKLKKLLFQF